MLAALEARVVEASRASARAEFDRWDAVLQLREQLVAEIEVDESTPRMYRRMAVNAVALDIARLLHLGEQQIWRIISQGSCLRDQLPTVWSAFAHGSIDAQKASVIAIAVERLQDPESIRLVNDRVTSYASEHTAVELRRWLNKVIDRLEPTDVGEADEARDRRFVGVEHGRNGMSEIRAYIPSSAAVAIRTRLRKGAKAISDHRTQEQKEADLFCAWTTNATGTECDIRAEIAVVIEAASLAGATDAPAHVIDVDDDVPVPAGWIFGIAAAESTLWTRLITDPAGRVLDVTHLGYQPPEALRRAVQWRDMTCRVRGCNRRAELTDLDYVTPFDAGRPTSGTNLQCLCRRHHGMKGHSVLAADALDPPAVHITRLPSTPLVIEYVAA